MCLREPPGHRVAGGEPPPPLNPPFIAVSEAIRRNGEGRGVGRVGLRVWLHPEGSGAGHVKKGVRA